MTYKIRRSSERQYFDHGWLKTYHTFSFASYYDPNFMGFRDLRVINEDRVAPKHGFPPHDHQDMEIISLVVEGALAHKDSTGTESMIQANEIQVMSAGTGITHSEYNPSDLHVVHFLQIWIKPNKKGISPRYQQMPLPAVSAQPWLLIASNDGRENSMAIQQDVELYLITLEKGKKEQKSIESNRYGWLQVIEGDVKFNEDTLHAGDGVAIDPNTQIAIEALSTSKILFFHLK